MSSSGRRTARRIVSPTGVLSVLLPLLTVGALVLVRPETAPPVDRPADEVPVAQVDLVCPSATGPEPLVAVAPAGGRGGEAALDSGTRRSTDVELRSDAVTALEGREQSTFVRAGGELAAQLLGTRFQPRGLAASECQLPRPTSWFTGVGADADHASVLELANPDSGPAVADVTVLGRNGPLDVPELRGLTVQGGRSLRVDLTEAVPTTSELALQVVVSRGRLGVSVDDGIPALGERRATRDWSPSTAEPATDQLLLGVVEGDDGRDTLALANPGEDEARVELRVVTADAAFVPEGLDEIAVAPGTVESVPLTAELRSKAAEGALGLRVTSTAPVTVDLSSVVSGDLSHAVPVEAAGGATTALVPPGRSSVVLAGSERAGVAVVAAYDDGRLLAERRIELDEGSGATVPLPRETTLLRVTPHRTSVAGAIVTTGDGATVVPLRELLRTALVPDVRPGLPE